MVGSLMAGESALIAMSTITPEGESGVLLDCTLAAHCHRSLEGEIVGRSGVAIELEHRIADRYKVADLMGELDDAIRSLGLGHKPTEIDRCAHSPSRRYGQQCGPDWPIWVAAATAGRFP